MSLELRKLPRGQPRDTYVCGQGEVRRVEAEHGQAGRRRGREGKVTQVAAQLSVARGRLMGFLRMLC